MSSASRYVPASRRGRIVAAAGLVLVVAALGGLTAGYGGDASLGVLGGATLALVLLAAARAEMLARRAKRDRSPAPKALPRPAMRSLRNASTGVGEIRQTLDRQQLQLDHITELLHGMGTQKSDHRDIIASYTQLQAFVQLNGRFDDPPIVPPMRGWAASPDVVLHLVALVIRERPSVVVECGSGVSTTWLAAAARQYSPSTRVIALDHDAAFAQQTRDNLAQNGLDAWAEVRDAPLEPFGASDGPLWYSTAALRGLADVGLVFVDGPPVTTGPFARLPALEALSAALSDDAVLVLDDTIRREEQAIVAEWLASRPGMVERSLPFEKGASELRFRPVTTQGTDPYHETVH